MESCPRSLINRFSFSPLCLSTDTCLSHSFSLDLSVALSFDFFISLFLSYSLPRVPPPFSGLTLWLITAAAPVLRVPALSWFQLLWGVRACGLSHWLQLPLSSRCCHCTTAHWQGELHSSITNLPLLTALPVLYQLHNFKPHLSVGCTLHLLRQTDIKPIKKAFFFLHHFFQFLFCSLFAIMPFVLLYIPLPYYFCAVLIHFSSFIFFKYNLSYFVFVLPSSLLSSSSCWWTNIQLTNGYDHYSPVNSPTLHSNGLGSVSSTAFPFFPPSSSCSTSTSTSCPTRSWSRPASAVLPDYPSYCTLGSPMMPSSRVPSWKVCSFVAHVDVHVNIGLLYELYGNQAIKNNVLITFK